MLFRTVSEQRILNTVRPRTRQTGGTNLVQNNTSPCVIASVSIYLGACRYCMKLEQLWYKGGWVSKRSGISESRETHSRAPGSIIRSKLLSCGTCLQISHERWDVSIASPIEMAKMGDAQADENRPPVTRHKSAVTHSHTENNILLHSRLHSEQALNMSHTSTRKELVSNNSFKTRTKRRFLQILSSGIQ